MRLIQTSWRNGDLVGGHRFVRRSVLQNVLVVGACSMLVAGIAPGALADQQPGVHSAERPTSLARARNGQLPVASAVLSRPWAARLPGGQRRACEPSMQPGRMACQ